MVVVPTGAHLQELRSEGGMLDIPRGKDAQVTDQLRPAGFVPARAERLEYLQRSMLPSVARSSKWVRRPTTPRFSTATTAD